jgi:myo-inositol 2-dehydrogenase/D-chiro-inositol 1-dehydrogenase
VGIQAAKPLIFFLERYTQSFIAEMKAFGRSVLENCQPPVTRLDERIPVRYSSGIKIPIQSTA